MMRILCNFYIALSLLNNSDFLIEKNNKVNIFATDNAELAAVKGYVEDTTAIPWMMMASLMKEIICRIWLENNSKKNKIRGFGSAGYAPTVCCFLLVLKKN